MNNDGDAGGRKSRAESNMSDNLVPFRSESTCNRSQTTLDIQERRRCATTCQNVVIKLYIYNLPSVSLTQIK